MKRIAVFCDGTWNTPDIDEPTSVYKLSQAVVNAPRKGQLRAYFEGIGTEKRFDGPIRGKIRKVFGGAFGTGLPDKVKEAYQFISTFYRPGDEIYLFGFSRGAFTARSVAGMIRKCGILQDPTSERVNVAFELYRKRGVLNHPDANHIRTARQRLSPHFASSEEDLRWRNDGSHLIKIAYLGVFDTVGARGIPVALFGPIASIWNQQYKFHDMKLSSSVASARHAVAIDERRVFYQPAVWDNLHKLNKNRKDDGRPYQQMWFVGNHGLVGGSADSQAISAFPFKWILDGAPALKLDPSVRVPPADPDILADSRHIDHKGRVFKRWRSGPEDAGDIHPSVLERARARADYKPLMLSRLGLA